jgi:hyperosmotically inducible protein
VNFRVTEGQVQLLGEVSQPFKKDDLARLAQHVAGVEGVANDLKVLPLSSFDNELRLRVARAIYRDSTLSRYGMGTQPSIHIIVENGHVTLDGIVNNQLEKQVAGMRASSAGLSFGPVINNLRVENGSNKKS